MAAVNVEEFVCLVTQVYIIMSATLDELFGHLPQVDGDLVVPPFRWHHRVFPHHRLNIRYQSFLLFVVLQPILTMMQDNIWYHMCCLSHSLILIYSTLQTFHILLNIRDNNSSSIQVSHWPILFMPHHNIHAINCILWTHRFLQYQEHIFMLDLLKLPLTCHFFPHIFFLSFSSFLLIFYLTCFHFLLHSCFT